MLSNKIDYKVCLDLPTTVDNVEDYLEEILDCAVSSTKTIFLMAKVEDKRAAFFGTGFSRYEVELSLPNEIKREEVSRYFEENMHCNVVYYIPVDNPGTKNRGKRK